MKVFSILFILRIAACALSEKCPPYEEITPCSCENMADTGNIMVFCGDETITLMELKQAISSLSGKKDVEIELDGLTLRTIPFNFFQGIGVKRLDISRCDLYALTEDETQLPLQGLEDTLEELVIFFSVWEKHIPMKLKLGHLQKLRKLSVSQNTITELSNDWFDKGPVSLESLYISNNEIEKLGDKAFASLINIEDISFDGNRFGEIQRSVFPPSTNRLTLLDLDDNGLTDLPEDLFSNMPSLTTLSLSHNEITRLEQKTFEPIWEQLEDFYVQENPLHCDSHMNWMFSLSTNGVYGTCKTPRNKEDTSLRIFIENKGQ